MVATIAVRDAGARYGSREVLRDVALAVAPGEVVVSQSQFLIVHRLPFRIKQSRRL